MDFSKITNLFNEFPELVKYAVALIAVLILILLVGWILKKITSGVRSGGRKGARVKVIETTVIDATRSLTLISRDGIEHLVLLGTNNDLVIESDIGKKPVVAERTAAMVAAMPLSPPPLQPAPPPIAAAPIAAAVAPIAAAPAAPQVAPPPLEPHHTIPPEPIRPAAAPRVFCRYLIR